jgi:hypothetical protein
VFLLNWNESSNITIAKSETWTACWPPAALSSPSSPVSESPEVVYSLMDGVYALEHARLPLRHPLGRLEMEIQRWVEGNIPLMAFFRIFRLAVARG